MKSITRVHEFKLTSRETIQHRRLKGDDQQCIGRRYQLEGIQWKVSAEGIRWKVSAKYITQAV